MTILGLDIGIKRTGVAISNEISSLCTPLDYISSKDNFLEKISKIIEDVDTKILNPRETWEDKEGYDLQAQKLVKMFSNNFDVFKSYVDIDVIDAAPNLQAAE